MKARSELEEMLNCPVISRDGEACGLGKGHEGTHILTSRIDQLLAAFPGMGAPDERRAELILETGSQCVSLALLCGDVDLALEYLKTYRVACLFRTSMHRAVGPHCSNSPVVCRHVENEVRWKLAAAEASVSIFLLQLSCTFPRGIQA